MEKINENTFEDFQAEPKDQDNWHNSTKYQQLLKIINYLRLGLSDRDTLNKFKEIVINRRRVEEHGALMRFLKSDEFVNDNLADLSMNCWKPRP